MEQIKLDHNTLVDALGKLNDYQSSREPQRIDEVLPIVLQLIKAKMHDIEATEEKQKFFAPAWVGILMEKLNNYEQLSDEEYVIFQSMVAQLKLEDYKICADNILGYEVRYLTANDVRETVSALKRYFRVR